MDKAILQRGKKICLAVGVLTLAACTSSSYGTRYGGPCEVDCMPLPMIMPQPVYYAPPKPQALPPSETITLTSTPEPNPAPVPQVITCPAGWMMGPSGTCLEIEIPTYVPPPTVGYPDPPKRPPVYKPKRK